MHLLGLLFFQIFREIVLRIDFLDDNLRKGNLGVSLAEFFLFRCFLDYALLAHGLWIKLRFDFVFIMLAAPPLLKEGSLRSLICSDGKLSI